MVMARERLPVLHQFMGANFAEVWNKENNMLKQRTTYILIRPVLRSGLLIHHQRFRPSLERQKLAPILSYSQEPLPEIDRNWLRSVLPEAPTITMIMHIAAIVATL